MALEIPKLDYSLPAERTAEQKAADELERLGFGKEIHRKRNNKERRRIAAYMRSAKWRKLVKAAEKAVLRQLNDEHREVHNARVQLEPENEAWD